MSRDQPLVPSDVFAGVIGPALLATGHTVDIAPAGPDDLDRVRTFYEQLGDASTYFRFFGIRRAIPDSELHIMVTQVLPRHVALLASIDGRLIGIGEFIVAAVPGEAELAFAVADDHHHEGVATLLLERLAVVARRCGLQRLVAKTMFGNQDMQLVLRTVGLAEHSEFDDGTIVFTLDLSSLDGLIERAAARREAALRKRATGS